jgi:hypothetical protein
MDELQDILDTLPLEAQGSAKGDIAPAQSAEENEMQGSDKVALTPLPTVPRTPQNDLTSRGQVEVPKTPKRSTEAPINTPKPEKTMRAPNRKRTREAQETGFQEPKPKRASKVGSSVTAAAPASRATGKQRALTRSVRPSLLSSPQVPASPAKETPMLERAASRERLNAPTGPPAAQAAPKNTRPKGNVPAVRKKSAPKKAQKP